MAGVNPLTARFNAGHLTPNSFVRQLPSIGALFGGRFNQLNIFDLQDIVDYFNNRALQTVSARLRSIFENLRANQCVDQNYHIMDVNMNGYNIIIHLLHYAQANPAVFGGAVNLNIPPLQNNRDAAAKNCTCLNTQAQCGMFQLKFKS